MKNEQLDMKRFGEFLQAVHSTMNPTGSRELHPRLNAAIGLNESVPADGGFTVPGDFSSILMKKIQKQTDIAGLCMQVPVTIGNRAKFPGVDEVSRANGSRFGGIQSTWTPESGSITASKGKFWSAELNLNKITSAVYSTEEILEDAALFGAFVQTALPLDAAFMVDQCILSGSGAGQPLGVLNSNAVITVAKDVSQPASTISPTNITGMFGRMLPGSRKNAVWLVGTAVEEALYTLPATNGAGALLFTPGDADAPFGRLLNRPVVPVEQCSIIGTPGDIVFFDPGMYLIAEKPPELTLSVHVEWVSGQCIFRFQYRVDGQPALRTPVASFNGGPTKSAFVALAERS